MSAPDYLKDSSDWCLIDGPADCVTYDPKKDRLWINPDGSVTVLRGLLGAKGVYGTVAAQPTGGTE